jgi:hypothetical protein
LYQFDKTPQETITNVLLLSFSPSKVTKVNNDSGRVHWPEAFDKPSDILNGKAVVPTHGGGTENTPSSEILECRFLSGQSINAQKAGILYFQKKYEQSQRINFSVTFSSLTKKATLTPGQVVTVDNSLYGGTNNVIITDMTILPDMRVNFTGVVLNHLEDWGDLTTTTKDVITDTSMGFQLATTDYSGNVSSDWDLLLNIPQRFLDTATLGINVTDSYMGYYDGTNFTVYIDANGNMRAGDPDLGQGFVWNQSAGAYTISGSLTVQNPAGVRSDLNVADGADVTQAALNAGAAIDYAKANGKTLISGGYIDTTLLKVSDIIATGSIMVVGDEVNWSSQVVGVGKPQDYADVTGQNTANDVLTGAGKAVAEHGADVTGQNTAYDTARIDGYNSAIIRQGSRTGIVNGFENSEIGDWSSVSQNTDSYSGTYAGLFTSTNTAPASSGTTGEPYITIPEEIALAFAGKRIKVSIIAKQPASGASSEFAVAYSTSDVGNSLWHYFTPTTSWQVFTFTYDVPEPNSGGTDFLGIWGDTSGGGNGVLVDNLQISMNQKESEFNALDLQNAPAEAGADVTANNTANDTSNVNGLPSANVSGWAHPTDRTTIHGGQIYTGTVTAQQIAAGTITAAEIAAGSITAESGVVGSLDADKITTGTLSAGSVKVSSNDGKTYFLGDTFFVYDASNQLRVKIGRLS